MLSWILFSIGSERVKILIVKSWKYERKKRSLPELQNVALLGGCLEDEAEKNFFFEWATNIVSTSIR